MLDFWEIQRGLNPTVADADDVIRFELPTVYHISGEGYDLILINDKGELAFDGTP